jgi:hypothetical protein
MMQQPQPLQPRQQLPAQQPVQQPASTGTINNQTPASGPLGTIAPSSQLQHAIYIAISDLARQTLGSGDVKLWKAAIVGASSLISQMLIAAPIDALINAAVSRDSPTADYIFRILSESLGITVALLLLNGVGVAKDSDVMPTDGEPMMAPKKGKRSKVTKAFLMAMTDVVIAEVLRYVTSMGYISGSTA